MKRVPVRRHGRIARWALVSDTDYASISERRWNLDHTGYAQTTIYMGMVGGKPKCRKVYMHREVMGMTQDNGLQVHHINHKRLDNRRENLEVCTVQANLRRKMKGPTHVTHQQGGWVARVRREYIGRYRTRELALEAVVRFLSARYEGEAA